MADSPMLYDDTIIYLVEVTGGGKNKPAMGVFLERRTAEAWIRSLGGEVQNRIVQTHLLDHREKYNLAVSTPDLSTELPNRELPPPNYGRPLPPPKFTSFGS